MSELGIKDVVGLINQLSPGFLAAWVFYGLSSHPKPSAFERVIQALIFTLFVQVAVSGLRDALYVAGDGFGFSCGKWAGGVELFWSAMFALVIGGIFARFANNDTAHAWLRDWGWTVKTSHPSEWRSAFAREPRWCVLHLKGGRRLFGWPDEWPDQPDHGHFLMGGAEWLNDDGTRVPLADVEVLLVAAADVEMVEFVREKGELAPP